MQSIELRDVNIYMLGSHQLQNASTATCAALCLREQGDFFFKFCTPILKSSTFSRNIVFPTDKDCSSLYTASPFHVFLMDLGCCHL